MQNKKAISLIVLVITIIVMIILATAIIMSLTNNKLFDYADKATNEMVKKQYMQEIQVQYALVKNSKEMIGKTNKEIFQETIKNLNIPEAEYEINSRSTIITIDPQNIFTLIEDGEVKEGRFAYLDIADGSIELYYDKYRQGETIISGVGYSVTGNYVDYTGDYIITGVSNENAVRIMEKGTYNITLKDLNIDMSRNPKICAFNANRMSIATDLFVNLSLEGKNILYSGPSAAGLGFVNGKPNVGGITNGSTLTIQGEGSLFAQGGSYSAGIGGGYTGYDAAGADANNIIINSGNITAKSGASYCTAIGGAYYKNANNIVINGGSIYAISATHGRGIGASGTPGTNGIAKGIVINGGNIVIEGKDEGAIGGEEGSENVQIIGGNVTLKNTGKSPVLGDNCSPINISGGTIIATSAKGSGVGTTGITENINITGGSLYLDVAGDKFAVAPKSGDNNVYLTEVVLENVTEETLVTSFTTSDNISYGIKDMYTSSDGKLYLYLPSGERIITIVAGGKTYSGQVVTSETSQEVILKEI